jgi:hypothetical protein
VVGFAVGALWQAADGGPATPSVAAAALLVGAAGDVAYLLRGVAQPLSIRTQVPRLWARIFPLAGATALYGLRLGVGPLTILRSWLWWSGSLVAATHGAWHSAAGGAAFGAVRILVQLAAVRGADAAMPQRMARVRNLERALTVPVLVAVAIVAGWTMG